MVYDPIVIVGADLVSARKTAPALKAGAVLFRTPPPPLCNKEGEQHIPLFNSKRGQGGVEHNKYQ